MNIIERLLTSEQTYFLMTTDKGVGWSICERLGETKGDIRVNIIASTKNGWPQKEILLARALPLGRLRLSDELDCITKMR